MPNNKLVVEDGEKVIEDYAIKYLSDKEIIDRVSENCSHIRTGCEDLAKAAGKTLFDEVSASVHKNP